MTHLTDWWMRLWIVAVHEPWDRHKDRVKTLASHDRSMSGLINWKENSQFHIREMERRLTDVEKLRKRVQVLEQRWEQPEETGDLK